MTAVHRNGDARGCGAATTVIGNSTVFINGKLAAVVGDTCTHGAGGLVSTSPGTVFVEGKKLIVITDTSTQTDNDDHVSPADDPSTGSSNVEAY